MAVLIRDAATSSAASATGLARTVAAVLPSGAVPPPLTPGDVWFAYAP